MKKTWKQLKKQGLLEVVVRVLGRDGANGLTMDNVAREAGVAKGTLYGYFKNKQDLLKDAIEASVAPMVDELKAILNSDRPPEEKLRNMTFRHLQYCDEHRDFFRIFAQDRLAAQARVKRYKSCRYHDFVETTGNVIEEGVKAGLFRPVNPFKVATILVEADIAMIHQRLLADHPGPVEADAALISDVMLNGIAVRNP